MDGLEAAAIAEGDVYRVDQVEPGWVTVYDLSPKDGTRENVSSYPVALTPGG
jgi:hypothetical protein